MATNDGSPLQALRQDKQAQFWMKAVGGTVAGCVTAVLVMSRIRVAKASQYIVKTGLGISDIAISKMTVQWPFQRVALLSVEPSTFPIEVDAMSLQRIPFRMPSVWTIGPKNDARALSNYARFLMDKGPDGMRETVEGVIQGETRVLTANLDLNDLFSKRDDFKKEVVDKINGIISPFGLEIYNANIAELKDLDDHNQFFSEQKRRALQKVNQEARVNVAEALKDGEIGESQFRSQTRQGVADADRTAQVAENVRKREVAESTKDLRVAEAQYEKEVAVAKINAHAEAEQRRWELQRRVEELRQQQELERMRAEDRTPSAVQAEIAVITAKAKSEATIIAAEAAARAAVLEAEGKAQAVLTAAKAEAEATRLHAEADRYSEEQAAHALLAVMVAKAEGLEKMVLAAGGPEALNKYLIIKEKVLQELAGQQATALKGMNPTVNVWSTGAGGDSAKLSHTVTDLLMTAMPLLQGIKQQTGVDILSALPQASPAPDKSVPL